MSNPVANPVALLRDLHRLRKHAKNLQDEIERLPKLLRVYQGKVAAAERAQKELNEQITKLKLSVKEKEGKLKDTHQLLEKKAKQLNEAGGKKEYDAGQTEIRHAKETAAKLEEESLAAMEQIDVLTAKLPELAKAVQIAKDEVANFDKIQKEKHGGLKQELTVAQAAIKEVEPGLPADIREQYDRMIKSMGEDAMSVVNGRTCAACYTEITAQMSNNLAQGFYVPCKSCGRALYLPE